MTRVFLVRHAQAEGNLFRRSHGQFDSLLLPDGYRQIAALEERFADIHIDACYSSDLFRTKATAAAVYKPKGLELMLRPKLREIHMGIWEDATWGRLREENRESHIGFIECRADWQVPGSETFFQLRTRMAEAIEEIVAAHPNQTVAVFSHGMAIRNYLAHLKGYSPETLQEIPHGDNTSVSLITFEDGTADIEYHADASHLTPEISTFARQNWWRSEKGLPADLNFSFRPYTGADRAFVEAAHEGAWQNIYGLPCPNLAAFVDDTVADATLSDYGVRIATIEGKVVGLVQLSPESGMEDGYAHLSFAYLLPEYRHKGYGCQLLGETMSLARKMGRNTLRLYCSKENTVAQAFYKKFEFSTIGQVMHAGHRLDEMVLPISTKNSGCK